MLPCLRRGSHGQDKIKSDCNRSYWAEMHDQIEVWTEAWRSVSVATSSGRSIQSQILLMRQFTEGGACLHTEQAVLSLFSSIHSVCLSVQVHHRHAPLRSGRALLFSTLAPSSGKIMLLLRNVFYRSSHFSVNTNIYFLQTCLWSINVAVWCWRCHCHPEMRSVCSSSDPCWWMWEIWLLICSGRTLGWRRLFSLKVWLQKSCSAGWKWLPSLRWFVWFAVSVRERWLPASLK